MCENCNILMTRPIIAFVSDDNFSAPDRFSEMAKTPAAAERHILSYPVPILNSLSTHGNYYSN
jgi:hypothetical protein